MESIIIQIEYCNNIDKACLVLAKNKLNIKFAPNGTGKSTLAKAVLLRSKGDTKLLNQLIPFKFRKDNPENKQPKVDGADGLKNIICFNEEYVSQFVFKADELLSNSFDIFIRTDAYKQKEKEIENLVSKIKNLFVNNQELESLITTLKEMGEAFKISKTGLSKKSPGVNGLSAGNKIEHIPEGLEAYTPFIKCKNSVGWIDWQTKGYEYADLSDSCPYCTSNAKEKKEQIRRIGQEYDKNTIKNLIAIISVIETLGDYFSEKAKEKLNKITHLKSGIEKEHEDYLVTLKTQIDNFLTKLEKLKTLSGFQFKDGERVAEKLPEYKLNLVFFSELESQKMIDSIDPINSSIDEVIEKAGQLQGMINQQRTEVTKTVEKHKNDINGFLAYAGYRYEVDIVGEGEGAQLKLRHIDHEAHLAGGNQHLSFGERNAFAIVLFMYECLAKKPDLIILDDPISSFDKNKKYAILEMLFRRDAGFCLKSKTVLMLTHDVEPIIDTVKSLSSIFYNQMTASFLKLSNGNILECNISREDILNFTQICTNSLKSNKDDLIKLIYLRRFYEIIDLESDGYQVLSNLFHKRSEPGYDFRESKQSAGYHPKMTEAKFKAGCSEISAKLTGFSYSALLTKLSDVTIVKSLYYSSGNGYEKLQLFRLLGIELENSVIQKFINETYHIENEYICQLDPSKFDTIPEYVISECDKMVSICS